jgi:hypothetical protein
MSGLDLSRFDGYESRPWVVHFWGTCCDTGKFTKVYRFNTEAEAYERYNQWFDDPTGWSDGPSHMDPPFYEPRDEEVSGWGGTPQYRSNIRGESWSFE